MSENCLWVWRSLHMNTCTHTHTCKFSPRFSLCEVDFSGTSTAAEKTLQITQTKGDQMINSVLCAQGDKTSLKPIKRHLSELHGGKLYLIFHTFQLSLTKSLFFFFAIVIVYPIPEAVNMLLI